MSAPVMLEKRTLGFLMGRFRVRFHCMPSASQQLHCEGGVDVVGVVTSLRGGAQVVLHGVQVVEFSVLLGVHKEGEVEEDGEGQVEVEKEEGEVREKRTWMTMG